ncbi:hypothetical protein BJ165DRAFT_1323347, partial [Panaeolus papilionaceus]
FQNLPFDVLAPILSHLTDRRDWHACCLVSKAFARIATPFLYRTLDSRRISNKVSFLYLNHIHHPSSTILKRPDLAHYVRHVTETVSVHRSILSRRPRFTRDTLTSLSLCKNLKSMTWIDDSISTDETLLLAFITVLRRLPLKELTIRTHNELGETVWTQLTTLTGLSKISLWCMEGPPRTLQGLDSSWAEPLGSTLTHLELGVSAFCYPPTELLSHLPLLRDLRLKGAPAGSIQTILSYLPNLQSLDTEYLLLGSGSGFGRWNSTPQKPELPALKHLTVRTSVVSSQKLWSWIGDLVPGEGLETFRLHALRFTGTTPGTVSDSDVPRHFIVDLARLHGSTLREFNVGEATLSLEDIYRLSTFFPLLEVL